MDWITIIMMGVVGGFIGWMTNYFAIGMLFRPYQAIRVGRYTLPFTPGVIPKRRKDIAKSIGRIVGQELIHTKKVTDQILNKKVRKEFKDQALHTLSQAFRSEKTPADLLKSYLNLSDIQIKKMETSIIKKLQKKLNNLLARSVWETVEKTAGVDKAMLIGQMSKEVQGLLVQALQEPSFRLVLMDKIHEFLKGLAFGKLVSQAIPVEKIADKIISGIHPHIGSETVYEFIYQGILQTWKKYENEPIGEVLDSLGILQKENLQYMISDMFSKNNPFHQRLCDLLADVDEKAFEQTVLDSIDYLFESPFIHSFLQASVQKIDFQQLVENEINHFSLPELEAKIYEIAHRELFMIQVLGGVLGFFIGVVQAFFILYVFPF